MPFARRSAVALAALVSAGGLSAQGQVPQKQVLPGGTGNLTVPASWTMLTGTDLAAAGRPSDPKDEPARSLLLAIVADARQRGATAEHAVLHAPGTPAGALRVVDTFADARREAPLTATSIEATVGTVRALEVAQILPAPTVTASGHDQSKLWPIDGLVLHFLVDSGGVRWNLDHHIVHAGDRAQHFTTLHRKDDPDGASAIATVVSSFDGAREPATDVTRTLILGGISGAVAGMVAALVRKLLADRSSQRRAAKAKP